MRQLLLVGLLGLALLLPGCGYFVAQGLCEAQVFDCHPDASPPWQAQTPPEPPK